MRAFNFFPSLVTAVSVGGVNHSEAAACRVRNCLGQETSADLVFSLSLSLSINTAECSESKR